MIAGILQVSERRLRINGYSANLAFDRIHAFVEGPASRAIRLRQAKRFTAPSESPSVSAVLEAIELAKRSKRGLPKKL